MIWYDIIYSRSGFMDMMEQCNVSNLPFLFSIRKVKCMKVHTFVLAVLQDYISKCT